MFKPFFSKDFIGKRSVHVLRTTELIDSSGVSFL